tara:strand:+ start:109 stop:723 length:615 start_codon:yes stop_codon:yes gene_type:complete
MSETTWEWPYLKGGEAWKDILLDITTNYNLTITRSNTMTKQANTTVVSPLSKVISNPADAKENTNKEVSMNDATSGTVTLTKAEYELLVKKSTKKAGDKATTCTKKWLCKMKRSEIATSGATPQMRFIMNCIAQEAKENPDVEYHESAPIVERLMDPENPDAMQFSKTYRDQSDDIKLKRLIEVMNYYAHPDFRAELSDDFDVR